MKGVPTREERKEIIRESLEGLYFPPPHDKEEVEAASSLLMAYFDKHPWPVAWKMHVFQRLSGKTGNYIASLIGRRRNGRKAWYDYIWRRYNPNGTCAAALLEEEEKTGIQFVYPGFHDKVRTLTFVMDGEACRLAAELYGLSAKWVWETKSQARKNQWNDGTGYGIENKTKERSRILAEMLERKKAKQKK